MRHAAFPGVLYTSRASLVVAWDQEKALVLCALSFEVESLEGNRRGRLNAFHRGSVHERDTVFVWAPGLQGMI